MIRVTVGDIVQAVGGKLLSGSPETVLEHISIDSRKMEGNDLFVPFKGEHFDAHDFIGKAFAAGAAASLSTREDVNTSGGAVILIQDTLTALQAIGRWYRSERLRDFPIVGVTGSVGKTSTREMIQTTLSAGFSVFSTKGNFNGQIGVPLTLSQMDPGRDQIAVLEMGMSLPGEMERIARTACVDCAVMTNIGVSHIENLGSQANICAEKLHIIDGMKDGGLLILNGDDPILSQIRLDRDIRIEYYGTDEKCRYRILDIRTVDNKTVFDFTIDGKIYTLHMNVPGAHHVRNAMAALAVAVEYGVDINAAIQRVEAFAGFSRRMEVTRCGDMTIIDDAYNASPDSMRAAISVLDTMETRGRKIAVLADMLELGEKSPEYHFETGLYAVDKRVDFYVFIGDLSWWIGRAIDQYTDLPNQYFRTNEEAASWLIANVKPEDIILFKGSNGMHLNEVIAALRGAVENNQ